jgi:uridine phosphorylase
LHRPGKQIVPSGPPPYFVIIDRALRDEGTSYHHAPAAEFADAEVQLVATASKAMSAHKPHCVVGSSWTTDAPFRDYGCIDESEAELASCVVSRC